MIFSNILNSIFHFFSFDLDKKDVLPSFQNSLNKNFEFSEILSENGCEALESPAVKIEPPEVKTEEMDTSFGNSIVDTGTMNTPIIARNTAIQVFSSYFLTCTWLGHCVIQYLIGISNEILCIRVAQGAAKLQEVGFSSLFSCNF